MSNHLSNDVNDWKADICYLQNYSGKEEVITDHGNVNMYQVKSVYDA